MSLATRMARTSWMPKFQPSSSCKLWLPGQDDPKSSTVRDRSGSKNNGTITGASWARTPKGLWYLSYDGTNDSLNNVGTVSSFNFFHVTGIFAIELWLKFTDYTAAGNRLIATTLESISTAQKGFSLRWMATNDEFQLLLADAGSVDWIINSDSSNNIIADNNWHHLVVTGDATNVFFQVDGVRETGSNTVGTLTTGNASNALQFGEVPDGSGDFAGGMALQRIYDTTMSSPIAVSHYRGERHLFGV